MGRFTTALVKPLAITLAITLLGAWPVHAFWGRDGVIGLALGAGAAFLGAIAGRIPQLFFRQGPDALFYAAFAGVGVRLLATLVLAAPLMLLAPYPRESMAIGLVLTYLSLLVVEVRDLLVASRGEQSPTLGRPHHGHDGAPTR